MKLILWIGSSRKDLKSFPEAIKDIAGYALYAAQRGGKHPAARPLKGFHGSSVLEITENYFGNAYRIVYTTKFERVIYVLHAFEKKSKSGVKTPKQDMDLIHDRLKAASEHYSNSEIDYEE